MSHMSTLCCSQLYWFTSPGTHNIISIQSACQELFCGRCQQFSSSFFPLFPSPPSPKEPTSTQTPFFQVILKKLLFWQRRAFSFLQILGKPRLRKWYMARKRPSPSNLIRSLHCSAGFQEDRSPRQLDGNTNHTMLKQLSHIHSMTKIHLFIISCNTVWDKVHC